ncbi:hypothetical protein FQZ97_880780 [compost metagenome]
MTKKPRVTPIIARGMVAQIIAALPSEPNISTVIRNIIRKAMGRLPNTAARASRELS